MAYDSRALVFRGDELGTELDKKSARMVAMAFTPGSNTIDGPHGEVHVFVWPAADPTNDRPIVAVHGVDGNHQTWAGVADALAGSRTLIAMDLRGRAASSHEGPFGVVPHAQDLEAVVDAAEGGNVTLLGHSFGGHVVARLAADRPAGLAGLVLVDGGPPRVVPDEMAPEALVAGALSNIVPNLGSKPYAISREAVEYDFASMVVETAAARALFDVTVPVHLLRAELGVAPGLPPVVPDIVVAELEAAGVSLTDELVPDVTHFSILGDPALTAVLA